LNLCTVSIIIPTFNRLPYLKCALGSVEQQTFRDFEVLVLDDGSTDGTYEFLGGYSPNFSFRWFRFQHKERSYLRNFGAHEAKGEFLAFLDDDDEWLPEFVKSHIKLIDKNPDVKWTYCRHEEVTQNGSLQVKIPKSIEEEIVREGLLSYFRAELARFGFGKCGFLIRRSVFDELGNFDPAMPNGMDSDMWRRIALRVPLAMVR